MTEIKIIHGGELIGPVRRFRRLGTTWHRALVQLGSVSYAEDFHDHATARQFVFWRRGVTS